MKKYSYIISSAPIDYKIGNLDLYDSFDYVSRGMDAPLSQTAIEFIKKHKFFFDIKSVSKIFSAPCGQTYETASLIQKNILPEAKIIKTNFLKNINFKMSDIIPKNEFISLPYNEAIVLARRSFIERFFDGKLSATILTFRKKIEELKDIVKNEEGNVLFIGHSFPIKIMEVLIKNPNLEKDRSAFIKAFCPENRPYNFLEGFTYPER